MRASVASLSKKLFLFLVVATLAFGFVPSAALAMPDSLQPVPGGSEGDVPIASSAEGDDTDAFSHYPSEEAPSTDGDVAAASSEDGYDNEDSVEAAFGDEQDLAILTATQRVNEDIALTQPVAQQESTRSYFLAQTLESTKTVPIVSANLPLDTSTVDSADEADIPAEGEDGEDEGIDDSDESDLPTSNIIAADSTVIGSFTYRGITYALEPGGESVAIVAADYLKLPNEFIEAHTIVLPSVVIDDDVDYYSVTRIADYAFASLASEMAAERVSSAETGENSDETSSDSEAIGITAITIPASITSVGDDAFTGFDSLRYIIVSEDNPTYGMYNGCLYNADLTSLLLIPEGRLGTVRVAPSVTEVKPEAFSHCPSVDTLVADPDSAAYPLLKENVEYCSRFISVRSSDADSREVFEARYSSSNVYADWDSSAFNVSQRISSHEIRSGLSCQTEYALVANEPTGLRYIEVFSIAGLLDEEDADIVARNMNNVDVTMSSSGKTHVWLVSNIAVRYVIKVLEYHTDGTYDEGGLVNGVSVFSDSEGGLIINGSYGRRLIGTGYENGEWENKFALKRYSSGDDWMDCIVRSWSGGYDVSVTFDPDFGPRVPTQSLDAGSFPIYLKFTPKQTTVTFDLNGGNLNGSSSNPSNIFEYNSAVSAMSVPSKPGYTFMGYFGKVASDGTGVGTPVFDADGNYCWKKSIQDIPNRGEVNNWGFVDSEIDLIAGWTLDTYRIDPNGGKLVCKGGPDDGANYDTQHPFTLLSQVYVNSYGGFMTYPADGSEASSWGIERPGYAFKGWSGAWDQAANYLNRVDKFWTNPGTSVLKVEWDIVDYTITYTLNSGTNASENPSSYNITTNDITLAEPSRTGYTFTGWSGTELTGSANKTPTVTTKGTTTGDLAFTANWTPNVYAVTLDAEGGKDGTDSVTATFDADMPTDDVTMPKKSGFTFAGYYDKEEGGNQYYTAKGESTRTWNKASDATLYAHWTKDGVSSIELSDPTLETDSRPIWYWPPNGYVIDDEDSTDVVDALDEVPNANDYDFLVDYEFEGYFDDKGVQTIDEDGTIVAGAQTENTTWYAKWNRVSCAVVLDATYGGTLDVEEGTKKIDRAMFGVPFADSFSGTFVKPDRVGYEFAGYYDAPNPELKTGEDCDGTQWIDGTGALQGTWVEPDGLAEKAPATLYAAWRLKDCDVRFDPTPDTGEEPVVGSVPNDTWHYGVAIPEKLPTPSAGGFSRNGYKFEGWYYEEIDENGDAVLDENGEPVRRYVSNPDGTRKFEKWDRDVANLTLKADWKANAYIVVFDEAYPQIAGEPTVESEKYEKTYLYDGKFDVADPTYDAYAFRGWYLKTQPTTMVAGSDGAAGVHTSVSSDGTLRFTPQGNLASQTKPAKIEVKAEWDAPADAKYHLYYWTPGAEDPAITVVDKTYSYGKKETLGISTYPVAVNGWNPTAGWVEVKATEDKTGDEAARALIAAGGPSKDAPTTSSFGPRSSEEKFFVFKWTAVPFALSFKDASSEEGDEAYVKATDTLEDVTAEDGSVLTWSQACAATKTGDAKHATSLAYDVTLKEFALPSVSRKGYDFVGWEQVSPVSPKVGDTVDPKEVADDEALHEIVLAPVFEESIYTIVLKPGIQGRQAKTMKVGYTDTFEFPYPDPQNSGACFSSWEAEDGDSFIPSKGYPVAEQSDGSFALSDLDADNDHEMTFTAIWNSAYNVTVPVKVTTMAIDTETGDMMAAGSALTPALKPASYASDKVYEVVSLRTEPILTDGNAPFSGASSGSVYLSVYADMAEPADETSLLRKANVRAKGVVSYTDKSNALRTATPLLVKLGDSSVSFADKGEAEGSISSRYGFRTFTSASPLYIRYGLVFEGVDPKVFDHDATSSKWTLPEKDSANTDTTYDRQLGWSSQSTPLAKLTYTVQLVNE